MITVLFIITYFAATVSIIAIDDKFIKNLDWLPFYGLYIVLAPITLPATLLVYFAYKFYNKLIKPRIDK